MGRPAKVSLPPLPEDDFTLEQVNAIFWESLLDHIRKDIRRRKVDGVLDIGCHNGGLLLKLATVFGPRHLAGIEPVKHSRERASFRLRTRVPRVTILSPERWADIPTASMDIVTCHEVLHLVEDLQLLFGEIERVLRPDGFAFVVAGCHSESPVWEDWSAKLRTSGQTVFDRKPFDILGAGITAGLYGTLRPLRRDGWIIYNPDAAILKYDSISEMFDYQYRSKIIFRFMKRQ